MINDMLQFSHTGNINVHPQPIDLSEMCHKIMQWIQQDSPNRLIDVQIDENMHVTGDQSLIMVVMKNLLGNAWKFTLKNNKPKIHVGTRNEAGSQVIFVKDNGAGFDQDKAMNLFTPFFRLHSQEEFTGTGIGLATAKRIIERHGGRIWAEGETGKGATFFFTLGEPR